MSVYKIKPCLLSDADQISLKSILELSHKRLNSNWQLIDTGHADLSIYSLSSEASTQALKQHSSGFAAVISLNGEEMDGVDIILKKPLRANNFAQTLNKIEEKIKFNNQAAQLAQFDDNASLTASKKQSIAKQASSLFSSLSKSLKLKKGPASDLPLVSFNIPDLSDTPIDTILDPELLKKWLNDLCEKITPRSSVLF
jgi:NCAIR mutase (PurE)-related protein